MTGDWTIWEFPVHRKSYRMRFCYGADVASGQTQASNKDPDWSVLYVDDVETGKTVARYRSRVRPAHLADEILKAAVFWRASPPRKDEPGDGMRGYPERNNHGFVTIQRLEESDHAGVFGSETMLGQRVRVMSDSSQAKFETIKGFLTTRKSKEQLVERLNDFLDEIGLPDGAKECPFDALTVQECLKFERDPRSGRLEAGEGHDDAVIAKALALEARVQEKTELQEEEPEEELARDGWSILERHAAGVRAQEAASGEDALAVNELSGLPGY